jgi:nitrous oxide reductase accessory protein NosL
MKKKLLVWLIASSLLAGCVDQHKPTPTPFSTPLNHPLCRDFAESSYSFDAPKNRF